MKNYSLPQSALNVIEAYLHLKAAENKYVRCPYFRNPKSRQERWGLAVYAGKGSPQDIEGELRIIEKLEGADFSKMPEEAIRGIMKKRKLGVECSGFITHVLDAYSRTKYKKPLHRLIKFNNNGLRWLFCRMRPYTHIDIETLTDDGNARPIDNIQEIMPGDLIRFNTEIDHAVIVTAIEADDSGALEKVFYSHSVLEENREGIKRGVIYFISPGGNLAAQRWQEEPETRHTINQRGEPKVYRLYIMHD